MCNNCLFLLRIVAVGRYRSREGTQDQSFGTRVCGGFVGFFGDGVAECSCFHKVTNAEDARWLAAAEAAGRASVRRSGQDGRHEL